MANPQHAPRYLVINHIPLGRGSAPGLYTIGDMWLEDLRAQAAATAAAGMRLVVCTPLVDKLNLADSGSFNAVEIRPEDHGFDYVPLPFYISMRQFLKTKNEVLAGLSRAIADSEIVHASYGGHPVAQGELAWPIAQRFGKKRIWLFDGADPFPRMQRHAAQEPNFLKRWAKKYDTRRFEKFCRRAIREADLVFSHNAAVVERFKDVWRHHCHMFDRSFVTNDILLTPQEVEERQRRLNDSSQPLRLVAAGRQIAIKATDHVLRALHEARSLGANVELEVMGDGDDLPKFKALAAELKLGDAARFSGTVPYGKPLFDTWSRAHVMVITNLTAEISRNVLLGMARGLPLIMYSNPGTDALIESCGAGMIVHVGDIPALAQAFVMAARDRKTLAEMVSRGVETARTMTLNETHRKRAELAAALLAIHPQM